MPIMPTQRSTLVCILAGTLLFAAACSPSVTQRKGDAPPGQVSLRGAGGTFPAPLYDRWFASYRKAHPDVSISYDPVGSGKGVERFVGLSKDLKPEDLVDFAASDAAMQDAEIGKVTRGVRLVPMTAAAIVLAYNLPGLHVDLKLSRAAYSGVFLGKITRWNDPEIVKDNPELKDSTLTITRVVRLDASGTTFAFTNHLDAASQEWHDRFGPVQLADWPGVSMRVAGNEGVATRVQRSAGAIGYVQSGFAERLGLKVAELENKSGRFVRPDKESATAALASVRLPSNLRLFISDPEGVNAYPVVTLTWILLYRDYPDSQKATAIRDLFTWCLGPGQAEGGDLGYIPLSNEIVTAALAAVASVDAKP
jgi:phosphate transport system substrate-binding protein